MGAYYSKTSIHGVNLSSEGANHPGVCMRQHTSRRATTDLLEHQDGN